MSITVDPPAVLPVEHLSVSSLNLLARCPERWRRRYLEREYEPANGKMILGSAVGAAEAQHYSQVIDTGEGYTLEQVQDEFSSEWEDRTEREQIEWGSDNAGELKDSGIASIDAYHTQVAPLIIPTSVERQFSVTWPGVAWDLTGFLDLEESDGTVADLKVRGKKLSRMDADHDLQPASYLYARRAEGNPAPRFDFHTMVRTKRPYAEVVSTGRTDAQLDAFADRVFAAAAEIAWRTEYDVWTGAAPGGWWCSERFCGYWSSCKFGGAR
jgi:hypothetical protein